MPESTTTGANPRVDFYDKFQQEMGGRYRNFEKKRGGDLDTTLISMGVTCVPCRGSDAYYEVSRGLVHSLL